VKRKPFLIDIKLLKNNIGGFIGEYSKLLQIEVSEKNED